MDKRVRTVQFKPGLNRHLVAADGDTTCDVVVAPRHYILSSPASVDCWLCRKRGGLLRPKLGKRLTAGLPGGKVHVVSETDAKPGPGIKVLTYCNLNFTQYPSAIKMRPNAEVTCGHCQRLTHK